MIAMTMHPVLLEKLNEGLKPLRLAGVTKRDSRLPVIPGKAHSVIGMRRTGKTTFLRQLQKEKQEELGPDRAVFLSFEDDRLSGLPLSELDRMLEEYYRRFPDVRGRETVCFYLDEIQLVPGWEKFVRRLMDTEKVEVVISGSSARLLSREVHTSLRGRSIETVIRPFSFREFLRHRGKEPEKATRRLDPAGRSALEKSFMEYMAIGGFPEAQGLTAQLRIELLQNYVTSLLLRDIVERYEISQVSALRWLARHCLRNPASLFSVHRFYADLKAQGLGVAKDALHSMLAHLEDSFLFYALPIHTDSERRRNSNPRKIYPADPALIQAFDSSRRANTGRALEAIVMAELMRRKADTGYVKTTEGFEVDFHVRFPEGKEELIQVCADPTSEETMAREVRALEAAGKEYPEAEARLLVLDQGQAAGARIKGIIVQPVYSWLLD